MATDDPRQRFSSAAQGYAAFRPDYPVTLVDWLVETSGVRAGARVADVGCGSGLLTRMLAVRGLDVVGIDPSEPMLAEARTRGGAVYRQGEAAATGLEAGSVALVTVAQAFHWFPVGPALDEFARVLRRDGWVAAVYNLRAASPFMDEYHALLQRFSSQYGTVESWQTTLDALAAHPRTRDHARFETQHAQLFDWEGLHGRAWSSSYVFRGVADRDGFDTALRALFEAHARGGVLPFPYRSVALLFRIH